MAGSRWLTLNVRLSDADVARNRARGGRVARPVNVGTFHGMRGLYVRLGRRIVGAGRVAQATIL